MNRSGKLIAKNDCWIKQLLEDSDYQIREDGTVWVSRNQQGHEIPYFRSVKTKNHKGYVEFRYKTKHLALHRVIYASFVGSLADDLVINHIDGNRSNNLISNLELVSQSSNNSHSYKIGKKPNRNRAALTDVQVAELRDLQSKGCTNKQLREKFYLAKSTVSYIVNRRTYATA